jgi:hypothetical protein
MHDLTCPNDLIDGRLNLTAEALSPVRWPQQSGHERRRPWLGRRFVWWVRSRIGFDRARSYEVQPPQPQSRRIRSVREGPVCAAGPAFSVAVLVGESPSPDMVPANSRHTVERQPIALGVAVRVCSPPPQLTSAHLCSPLLTRRPAGAPLALVPHPPQLPALTITGAAAVPAPPFRSVFCIIRD